jgi:hypothetical protein
VGDFLVEGIDVGWGTETGLAPGLFTESLGQPLFQVVDSGVEPDGAFVGGEQVGVQRGSADRRVDAVTGGGTVKLTLIMIYFAKATTK